MLPIGRAIDSYTAYKILTIIATDWKQLPAYKLGIIDDKGTPLKKSWDLKTSAEKSAYTPLHILVFNLKRLLNGVPGIARKIGTVAAAMWLLKEQFNISEKDFNTLTQFITEAEVPANTSAGGNVAGLDNNPPVRRKTKPDEKHNNDATFHVDSTIMKQKKLLKKNFPRRVISSPLMENHYILLDDIYEYAINNPEENIIIKNVDTNEQSYIRYGIKDVRPN